MGGWRPCTVDEKWIGKEFVTFSRIEVYKVMACPIKVWENPGKSLGSDMGYGVVLCSTQVGAEVSGL